MAITFPVSLIVAIIGDGETATLDTYLAPLFIANGLPGTTVPKRLITITMSDGSTVTGEINGQTLTSTFDPAPADLAQLRISVTLGV
jgi:hypothetical protein